jgi:putative transposase
VKYAWIEQQRPIQSIERLCRLMSVSKSGYLAWAQRLSRPLSIRRQADADLLTAIRAAHAKGRGNYGPTKIAEELKAQGIEAGLNRIKRLRRQHGIVCKRARKWKATTNSKHALPVAANLLDQQFDAVTAPSRVWVADITFIPTDEGWLYLAGVKDLYTRELVGWAMGDRMTKELTLTALRMAYWKKKPVAGLVHHSDRGSQYCSHAYQTALAGYGMQASMSRKGNCYDNAPMESFFGTLKMELTHHAHYVTREQARRDIFEYIEVFYNRIRRHARLQYLSPADFEKQFYAMKHAA